MNQAEYDVIAAKALEVIANRLEQPTTPKPVDEPPLKKLIGAVAEYLTPDKGLGE